MKFFNTILLATTLVILLAGCATISTPEGGPRDQTAPTLVSSNPKDQQLNVKTNTITLEFDEEIMANNLNKELLITPNLDNTFKVRTDKNEMRLIFEKPFQDSTTYILSFGKGIQDITEKNTAENLKLAFSTSSYIDSSRVSGTVVDLLTNEPLKEAIVAMYPANDTLSIRKNKPYYQTKANATGQYTFSNVREGTYRIYALQDQNNNSLYDNEKEKIAYKQKPIQVTPKEQQIVLTAVKLDTKKPVLLKRDRYADRLTGAYNEGIQSFSAKREEAPKDTLSFKIAADGKTVDVFKTPKFTGGKAIFTAVDSSGNISIDSLQIEFGQNFPQIITGARIKVTNNTGTQNYAPGQALTIELQTPVKITGATPVTIAADTATRTAIKYPEQVKLDKTGTELTFTIPTSLRARTQPYTILLDSTQLIPLEGKRLSLPELQFELAASGGTGSVTGKISTTYKSFIVQLLNSNNKVVDETRNRTTFNFKNKAPGTYRIRILLDENNNGKWDGPDASFEREAERIFFYQQPITIRANWDLEDIKIEIK